MINISKIDDKLSIYKDKKVILWGIGNYSIKMFNLMQYHNINVVLFCNPTSNYTINEIQGIPVVSKVDIGCEIDYPEHYCIQSGEYIYDETTLKEISIEYGINLCISAPEAWQILRFLAIEKISKKDNSLSLNYSDLAKTRLISNTLIFKEKIPQSTNSSFICVCSAFKTGTSTLYATLKKNNIEHLNLTVSPKAIDKKLVEKLNVKLKILVGVREPIAQNISNVFQLISGLPNLYPYLYHNMQQDDSLLLNGGNMQDIFDNWLKNITKETNYNEYRMPLDLQNFIPFFEETITPILINEFNKNKGYQIIKDGNIEIFVYQLEKLSKLVPILSEFISHDISQLINDNSANEKWISESYANGKANIKFSQEYFDYCFSQPYVKHCYSDEDIEKFKSKWRKNIK